MTEDQLVVLNFGEMHVDFERVGEFQHSDKDHILTENPERRTGSRGSSFCTRADQEVLKGEQREGVVARIRHVSENVLIGQADLRADAGWDIDRLGAGRLACAIQGGPSGRTKAQGGYLCDQCPCRAAAMPTALSATPSDTR